MTQRKLQNKSLKSPNQIFLKVRSPVFEVMFSERWNQDSNKEILLEDVDPKIFKKFLQLATAEEANYHALFKSKRFSDVTFVFGSKLDKDRVQRQAHQLYLRSRSTVLNRMLETSRPGTMVEIEITDANPDVFQIFLEFVYGDKFNVSVAQASDLLYLADNYGVGLLSTKCKELLERGATEPLVE